MKNRTVLNVVLYSAIVFCLIGVLLYTLAINGSDKPIKVGILHSLTGTMAISEKAVVDATLMAIEEINAEGGVLGRIIEPIVVDGRSDWPTFADEAERLITEEEVSVVFGCWTSASRKTVKPIFEKHNHLLFYPVQYEGLEQSANIVYTGAAPNQQITPAVKWSFDNLGKTFFLVGSDYVFPRTANAIMKDQIKSLRGEVLGEEYVLLGGKDFAAIVQKIVKAKPDVILNTINGGSNLNFFRELRAADITPEKIPTMSFSVAEDELRMLNAAEIVGDYAAWNYFQSVSSEENTSFVKRYKARYGEDRVTDDPIEAGYFGVYLWAQAVMEAGTDETEAVRQAIGKQSMAAPGGVVRIDAENQHTWKVVRIGRIRTDGQFDVVWSSGKAVRPIPFPASRTEQQWAGFLTGLYDGWDGHWAKLTE